MIIMFVHTIRDYLLFKFFSHNCLYNFSKLSYFFPRQFPHAAWRHFQWTKLQWYNTFWNLVFTIVDLRKIERIHDVLFVMTKVNVSEINGHFRWINCFKALSKTKILRVKDKQSWHLSIVILLIMGDHCIFV